MDVQDGSNGKSIQVGGPEKPIHRLPEELLVYVFKIIIEYNLLGIGRLLFVSQYWYSVIQNTPSLWSRIRIAPRISNDVIKYTQYAMVALVNSVDSLLDITIDLRLYTNYLDERGDKVLREFLSEPDEVGFGKIFQILVGNDGSSMARWRSLRVRIPELPFDLYFKPGSVIGRFIGGLRYPTPHLQSLSIHLNSADEHFPKVGGPLQDLRRLKRFTMDAGGHLGYFNYDPKNIEVLCFRLWGSTKVMAPFLNLRHLSVSSMPNHGITHEYDPVIVLPLLESLTFGVWGSLQKSSPAKALSRKIHAPILDTLRLLHDKAILTMNEVTSFRHVRALDLLSQSTRPDIVLDFIHKNLPDYTALTSLTVCPWHLEGVMNGLRSLRDQGRAPMHFGTTYTIVSDNEGTLLDQSTMNRVVIMGRLSSEYLYRSHSLSG